MPKDVANEKTMAFGTVQKEIPCFAGIPHPKRFLEADSRTRKNFSVIGISLENHVRNSGVLYYRAMATNVVNYVVV